MSDLALVWTDYLADVVQDGAILRVDEGLYTAIIISLFSDRRATDDDVLPGSPDDRRGWWADAFPGVAGDQLGSRLWLLQREKQLQSVVVRAREYALEALDWLLADGVAQSVQVTAEIVAPGVLGLGIEIVRPDGTDVDFKFDYLWEATRVSAA